jgi:hypothetical protein
VAFKFNPGAFNSGAFDLGAAAGQFTPGGALDNFQTGIDLGGGFGGTSSNGGFLNGLAGRLGGLFNNNGTGQALGIANTLGNYGIQAANINNQAARVGALNSQTFINDDFLDQFNAAKLKQGLDVSPEARQKNLMTVIPTLANSIGSITGSPESGFQAAARASRFLA